MPPEAIGLDIGGTRIKACRVASDGSVQARGQCDTATNREAWLARIERLILDVRGNNPADLVGLGVACRGIIDPETTTVLRLPGVLHELQGERLDQILAPIAAGLPIRRE